MGDAGGAPVAANCGTVLSVALSPDPLAPPAWKSSWRAVACGATTNVPVGGRPCAGGGGGALQTQSPSSDQSTAEGSSKAESRIIALRMGRRPLGGCTSL
jgi:hypothetical protein